jgi:hypothetical protein
LSGSELQHVLKNPVVIFFFIKKKKYGGTSYLSITKFTGGTKAEGSI